MDTPSPAIAPPLAPLPLAVEVGVATFPDRTMVALTCMTPQGLARYFLDVDVAERLASNLSRAAVRARSGLVVAGST